MKKILTVLTCILLSLTALAQSVNMLSMARSELAKRGLEEAEVRARLMEEGIDVDAIPPTEYAAYQSRVMDVLNKLQAEKAGAGVVANANQQTFGPEVTSGSALPRTTVDEAVAENNIETTLDSVNVANVTGNEIYGHSLFTGKTMDVFRTTDGAIAPETYVLGEGDEVHISIFGSSQTEIHQRIGADGSIQPTGATKIFLKGMTLAQGRKAIISKLAQHYSFRQDQIAVTITTARTISVSIYGEVGVQGGFTLSALNTAFNALAAAGGPTEMGSIRNIQRSRGGKTSRLDLYKYMRGEIKDVPYDLQNNDVLFVPVAQTIVTVEGAVKRPMRYEMAEGETIKDLIEYAGGLQDNALKDFVQVERRENGELKFLEYNLGNILSGGQKVVLAPGDIVRVKASDRPMENYVSIEGDVYYGGNFDIEGNRSLKGLLDKAKPRYTARTDYVFVERTKPDETVEVLTVPFPGVNGNPDFTLQERDAVRVLEQASYRDTEYIAVSGQVRKPFSKEFGLNDRMTVGQAIEYAGGLRPSVYPVAYIFRKDVTNPDKKQYIPVSLESGADTPLQPGDSLNVYDNTTYTNIGELRISGAVKNPVNLSFDSDVTIHDLISMAGGFTVGAAYDMVQVFRMNISKKDEVKFDTIVLTVDENYNPVDPTFHLQPYDHVVVRMTPNFTHGRTVEINGRVKYPGVYVIEDNRTTLSEIIKIAGGLLDDASPYSTLFRTYNNRGNIAVNLKDMKKHLGNNSFDPIVMDGDVVNVIRMENTVTIRELGTRMAQYVPDDFSSTSKTLVYQGGRSAKWYIDNYAGGLVRAADRRSLTVTLPNYQTIGTKRVLGVRVYPKVEPGSTVTVSIDQKKQEELEKPKEKVDWERIASSSLSTLTSIVSMVLLIERLN
jgi:protein involved in polysaccharide export with SLBB domain